MEEDSGIHLIIPHKALIPDTLYSFKICCVYKDIYATTPLYVNGIRSGTSALEEDDEQLACHCCCYCSLFDSEESMDLRKRDLAVLSIHTKSRELTVLSPKTALSFTTSLHTICNVYFIHQDQQEGLVILVHFSL